MTHHSVNTLVIVVLLPLSLVRNMYIMLTRNTLVKWIILTIFTLYLF